MFFCVGASRLPGLSTAITGPPALGAVVAVTGPGGSDSSPAAAGLLYLVFGIFILIKLILIYFPLLLLFSFFSRLKELCLDQGP